VSRNWKTNGKKESPARQSAAARSRLGTLGASSTAPGGPGSAGLRWGEVEVRRANKEDEGSAAREEEEARAALVAPGVVQEGGG
jgi:hypothetical protein